MRKYLRLALHLKLVHYAGQLVLEIRFETEAIRDWCLALSLLKERLVTALLINEEVGRGKLEIEVASQKKAPSRTQASFDPEKIHINITENDLDYVLHFFLKHYRDGIAEVDHIDLEVLSPTESAEASICFKAPHAAPPLSAEEAKRRLGL